jgi:hypothetical protein
MMRRMRGVPARLTRWLEGFRRDSRGQVALAFALAVPAVILIAVGGIDLQRVSANRAKLQDIADAAALAGANELSLAISDDTAIRRAEAFINANVAEWKRPSAIKTGVRVFERDSQRVIEVVLNGHNPSFFGNLLPPGGWNYKAMARAISIGMTPLCVLTSAEKGANVLTVNDAGRITAPKCLVHSNRDILVRGGSITASQVQAATSADGNISPVPGTGAAIIEDPFRDLPMVDPNHNCPLVDLAVPDILSGTLRLYPGVHCGHFRLGGDAVMILEPGEHWFLKGSLRLKDNAQLRGTDVVLVFDKLSKFEFRDQSRVNLDGRRTGAYAGMVLAALRGNTLDFLISSDHVDRLLGVIYIPDAKLIVDGRSEVARDSAWTVVVAKSMQLQGTPSLVINANYSGSSVPVPEGVGPRDGGSQLVD